MIMGSSGQGGEKKERHTQLRDALLMLVPSAPVLNKGPGTCGWEMKRVGEPACLPLLLLGTHLGLGQVGQGPGLP